MRRTALVILVLALLLPATAAAHDRKPRWKPVPTGSDQQYRGLDAVDKRVAWVGGSDGEVLRTTDGGRTWKDVSPPDTTGLLFRDVEAQDDAARERAGDRRGRRLADLHHHRRRPRAGSSPSSTTTRAPSTTAWTSTTAAGAASRSATRSTASSASPATDDGGRSWHVLPTDGMPDAVAGEFAFAASGTCLVTSGRDAWFASGGGASRVFRSHDGGFTWKVTAAPIPATDGRRRVLARVPQPARGRDGGRRLHGARQRRRRVGLHARRRPDLDRRRRPLRLPLGRRLGAPASARR